MGRKTADTGHDGGGADGRGGFLQHRERWVLLGILLLAALLRVLHLLESKANDPFFDFPSVDPMVYHRWAVAIAGGDLVGDRVFQMGPLYPYLLGGIYAIFGTSFLAARLVQLAMGVLNVLLVYLVGRRVFGRGTAVLAGLLFAANPFGMFLEGLLLLATLQVFLNLCLVLALLAARDRPSIPRWLAAGALLGLSALARPNVLLLVIILLPWLVWEVRRARASWPRTALHAAALCVGLVLAISPATIRNYAVSGDLVLITSSGGVNFYIGNGPDADGTFVRPRLFAGFQVAHPDDMRRAYRAYAEKEMGRPLESSEVGAFWRDRTLDHIREDPGRWLALLARKLGLFLNEHEIAGNRDYESSKEYSAVLRLPLPGTGAILPFALLGMVLAIPRFRTAFPLYAMVFVFAVALVLFFLLGRYRAPAMPFFIVFAAFAVTRSLELMARIDGKAIAFAGLVLIASFVVVHLDLVTARPSRYMDHSTMGHKYRESGRFPEAIEEYQKAVELNPYGVSAHAGLAMIYERMALVPEPDPRVRTLAIIHWTAVRGLARKKGAMDMAAEADRRIRRLER